MHNAITPTHAGLIRCLQAIADEAEQLGLTQTQSLLQQAIRICREENRMPRQPKAVTYAGRLH